MEMKQEIHTLDQAIELLLGTLDDTRKEELSRLTPNSREGNARLWMDEVIAMFGLNYPGCSLSRDIEQRFPDESVFKGPVFDNSAGIFEAEMVLHEARQALLRQKKNPL